MERRKIIQVDEKVPVSMLIPLSVQHMFAMFGASILVPTLFGIDPAIVLLMNGIGTILFIIITKGKPDHEIHQKKLHHNQQSFQPFQQE